MKIINTQMPEMLHRTGSMGEVDRETCALQWLMTD